jgi:aspartate/methionine/tyrosine aminotransferase
MPQLTTLRADELRAFHQRIRERYDGFARRGLKLNLTRGKPSSAQLDLCNELLEMPGRDGYMSGAIDCRNYGELQGLPELRALLAPIYDVTPDRIVLGGNTSLGLMHDAVVYALLKGTCDSARPWSKESRIAFICAVPGYDRHFSICNEFGIEMITVQLRDDGPDMDAVEKLVAADPQIKGMWCVPKYSNPSGAVYSAETIERLARMPTAAADFRLFWDNAYAVHHLTPERIRIANIDAACARHGHPNRAFIFGSTSKVTLAGSGFGLFGGSKDNVAWYLKRMEKRTIGGDKVNQLRHLRLLQTAEGIDRLMERHRAIIAPKFARRLLRHARRARWLRKAGRETGEGGRRRAYAGGRDASARQRSTRQHDSYRTDVSRTGRNCAGSGRRCGVRAAGRGGEAANDREVTWVTRVTPWRDCSPARVCAS